MSKQPPLQTTDDCGFCENTKRDMERLERRMQSAVKMLQRRMDIIELATLVIAKDKNVK